MSNPMRPVRHAGQCSCLSRATLLAAFDGVNAYCEVHRPDGEHVAEAPETPPDPDADPFEARLAAAARHTFVITDPGAA